MDRRTAPSTTRRARTRRPAATLAAISMVAAVVAGASSIGSAAPSKPDGTTTPTAPKADRVDRSEPSFSNPTEVDNPLFPISDLHSAILIGNDEGHLLKIETTLLPDPKVIAWKGKRVKTLVSQFVSYLDGRMHEVALDWYAQADDGSVWYFGEDVFNYEDGVVADTNGTWIAGKDGPPGMIMPVDPQLGDAFRPENIPNFES